MVYDVITSYMTERWKDENVSVSVFRFIEELS